MSIGYMTLLHNMEHLSCDQVVWIIDIDLTTWSKHHAIIDMMLDIASARDQLAHTFLSLLLLSFSLFSVHFVV